MPIVAFKNMAIQTFADGSKLDTVTGVVTPAPSTPTPTPTQSLDGYLKTSSGQTVYAPIGSDMYNQYIAGGATAVQQNDPVVQDPNSTLNQVINNPSPAPENQVTANTGNYQPTTPAPTQTGRRLENYEITNLFKESLGRDLTVEDWNAVKSTNKSRESVEAYIISQLGEIPTLAPPGSTIILVSPDGKHKISVKAGTLTERQLASNGWRENFEGSRSAKQVDANFAISYGQESSTQSDIPVVEQQANDLGNSSVANPNYVNAVFQQYHSRDATQQELDRFTGQGVLDVHNAIKAGMPAQESTVPEADVTGGTTPDTNVGMTGDNLTDTTNSYNLPNATNDYTGADMITGTNTAIKSLADYIAELTPPQTATNVEYDSLKDKVSALLEQGIDRTADQLSAEAELGLNQLRQDYAKLNADILRKTAEYNTMMQGVEGKPITMSSIIGQQGQINKMKASEIGMLQAQALGLQGQIETAQEIANRAVDLKYQTIETTLKVYEAQLNMIAEDLNKEEQIAFQAQQNMLADERDRIAEQKAIEKNVQSIALLAMQNGADTGLVDQITKAKTEIEASQIAGQLLNTEGWTYVSTPAERDRLKGLGYEITQAGGRTYVKPGTGASNPEVSAYVNQIRSGAMKISNVPANIRNDVVIALGSNGGGTPSTPSSPVSTPQASTPQGLQEGDVYQRGSSWYTIGVDGKERKATTEEKNTAITGLTPEEQDFDKELQKERDKLAKGGSWGKSWDYLMNKYGEMGLTNEQLDAILDKDKYYNN